jgi:rhodanese-related sulfurtransferase
MAWLAQHRWHGRTGLQRSPCPAFWHKIVRHPDIPKLQPKTNAMRQITATELHQRLQQGEPLPLLLDVREPHEFRYCHIPGSVNMPMGQMPAELARLDPQRETAVICHHGMRSAQVAGFLLANGFDEKKVFNLAGGVAAWAAQVDPSMPTY